jgi:hypothetical protein
MLFVYRVDKKKVSKFQLRYLRKYALLLASRNIKTKTRSQKLQCRSFQTQWLQARTQNDVPVVYDIWKRTFLSNVFIETTEWCTGSLWHLKKDLPVKRLYRDIFKEGFRGCALEGKDKDALCSTEKTKLKLLDYGLSNLVPLEKTTLYNVQQDGATSRTSKVSQEHLDEEVPEFI